MPRQDVSQAGWAGESGAGSVGTYMDDDTQALEAAAWAAAEGMATTEQRTLLEADRRMEKLVPAEARVH